MDTYPFNEVWNRIREATGWAKQGDLANFLNIKSPSVTGAKKRQIFPIEWAVNVALAYNINISWLLNGRGPVYVTSGGEVDRAAEGNWSTVPGESIHTAPETEAVSEPAKEEDAGHQNDIAATFQGIADSNLTLGQAVEHLAQIFSSGNQVLIRAINANLMAFSEAVESRKREVRALEMVDELSQRITALEKRFAELERENAELKRSREESSGPEPKAAANG